jgi:hypothetical protein
VSPAAGGAHRPPGPRRRDQSRVRPLARRRVSRRDSRPGARLALPRPTTGGSGHTARRCVGSAGRAAESMSGHRGGPQPANGGGSWAGCGRAPRCRSSAPVVHDRGGLRPARRHARAARTRRSGGSRRRRPGSPAGAARRGGRRV